MYFTSDFVKNEVKALISINLLRWHEVGAGLLSSLQIVPHQYVFFYDAAPNY